VLRDEDGGAAISVSGELLLLPQRLLPNPIVASSREHLGRMSGERKDEENDDDEEEEAGGGAGGEGYDADAMDEDEWEEDEEGEYDDEEEEEEVGDRAIEHDPSNDDAFNEERVGQDVGSGGRSANYSSMTMNDLWYRAFDCERIFRAVRPVHNESTWTFLRGVYVGVMMTASSATPAQHATQQSPDDPNHGNSTVRCRSDQLMCDHGPTINLLAPLGSGFRKAVQARQTDDGKGRGVYAAEAIRKGELVWTATASTARFPSGALYRQFLAIVPADLACDVLQWAYVQDVVHFRESTARSGNNDLHNRCCNDNTTEAIPQSPQQLQPDTSRSPVLRISVDLDEGSYMNGEDYDPNVGCLTEDEEDDGDDEESQPTRTPPSHCQQNFYALRDIRVGEELLCYYGDFATSDGWAEFGL
jgi:SET domain